MGRTGHDRKDDVFFTGRAGGADSDGRNGEVDNRKYKDTFHMKAKMIPADAVEEVIGHAPGGVCPFGINDGVEVYLDEV